MGILNASELKAQLNKTSAYEILNKFFDEGSFVETDTLIKSEDDFAEAVTGYGTVDGLPIYAFAQNSDVDCGVMSRSQAKKIVRLYDLAMKTGAPIVGFYDSVGGRLSQKNDLMAAYGDILAKASSVSGVVPQVSVVLGACLGTSALTAASADFIIMSKDAELSINTVGEDSSAEYNLSHGVASFVCDDKDASVAQARELVTYFPSNNLEAAPMMNGGDAEPDAKGCLVHTLADADSLCRVGKGFSKDVGTALGRINGAVVGFVATHGDAVDCKGGQKIAKFVRFCDAFSIPVVTVVDSTGFNSIKTAAKVTSAYAEATTAKISVVSGNAVGAVYIALAGTASNADMVFALDGAVISPVMPKALAFIMEPDTMNVPVSEQDKAAAEFAQRELSAVNAATDGYVDDVVDKSQIRARVASALEMLSSKRVETLPKKHSTI